MAKRLHTEIQLGLFNQTFHVSPQLVCPEHCFGFCCQRCQNVTSTGIQLSAFSFYLYHHKPGNIPTAGLVIERIIEYTVLSETVYVEMMEIV